MPDRLLDEKADQQLTLARALLADLQVDLAAAPATEEDAATLASSVRQLDELFLLVVVGEFNAGKSAFINALLGDTLLQEGVTPTTAQIHLIRYGATRSVERQASGIQLVTAPLDILRDIHLVDTPGTNAIIREHEHLTTSFVPRADLVLFVTSADRPFTETERAFMDAIRDWGKKIVIVVNKVDIFDRAQELDTVLTFVGDAAQAALGLRPPIFPVSARLAGRAKHGQPDLWEASRFEPLERYVRESLDERSRFRLKVSSPLGVGDRLARRYLDVAEERLRLLANDTETLGEIERQLAQYRADVARGFELRMTGVENVLLEMETRGHRYIDETLRLGRVFDLLNRARVQRDFEEQVVADAPRQIERQVGEIIDWLVDQDFRQWQAVSARLLVRQREYGDRILGGDAGIGSFHEDRGRLIDSVGREAQRVVEGYDRRRESEQLADGARRAVAATAAVSASAVGLGTLVSLAATTAAADITGILMASVVAALGLLIIPARRRRARTEIRTRVSTLRQDLGRALDAEFQRAQERSARRFDDAMAPYARFVRAEHERWDTRRGVLRAWRARASALLTALEAA